MNYFPAQSLIKLHIAEFFRKHQTLQVIFTGFNGKIFFEWTDTIIPQLAGSLDKEGSIGTLFLKIRRFANCKQMFKEFVIRGCNCRNLIDRGPPLPDRKRIFEYWIIINLFYRNAKFIFLSGTILLKTRQQRTFTLQHFQLKIFNFLTSLRSRYHL